MPRVSVFTPSHDVTYLEEAYQSLLAQDYDDWEWIVFLNGEKLQEFFWEEPYSADKRVRVFYGNYINGVGHAKSKAVQHCSGSILVELDHDDTLEPDCLSEVVRAFDSHPEASLVYSSFTQMNQDGTPNLQKFGGTYGWRYTEQDGYQVPDVLQPTPHNVSVIWSAPNHVRAFTREAYDKCGGYDETLDVLDDQDLMARLYRVGSFVPINRMLYRQRLHDSNTQFEKNEHIQEETWTLYEDNILGAATAWSKRNLLEVSDDSYVLARGNSTGVVRTTSLHERSAPERYMDKVHNSLAPNGMFLSMTPYWGKEFFQHYTEGHDAPFQVSRLRTFRYDGKPYVQANLIAVKDGYVRDRGVLANNQVKW